VKHIKTHVSVTISSKARFDNDLVSQSKVLTPRPKWIWLVEGISRCRIL